MLCFKLDAPFAVFRTFTAGWRRPTAGFLTPSAAYGLLLNVAGIEMRHDDGKAAMTLIRDDLPEMRIALGSRGVRAPRTQSMFQQLHNYPVGAGGGTSADAAKGRKNNITPVRREFLSDLRVTLAVETADDVADRIRDGLAGRLNDGRYGLPFLGDNNFLADRFCEADPIPETYWYCRSDSAQGGAEAATRLTVWIDRAKMFQTQSGLYVPTDEATSRIPEDAWTLISPT